MYVLHFVSQETCRPSQILKVSLINLRLFNFIYCLHFGKCQLLLFLRKSTNYNFVFFFFFFKRFKWNSMGGYYFDIIISLVRLRCVHSNINESIINHASICEFVCSYLLISHCFLFQCYCCCCHFCFCFLCTSIFLLCVTSAGYVGGCLNRCGCLYHLHVRSFRMVLP